MDSSLLPTPATNSPHLIPTQATQLSYIKESEEIRLAMLPLELIKRYFLSITCSQDVQTRTLSTLKGSFFKSFKKHFPYSCFSGYWTLLSNLPYLYFFSHIFQGFASLLRGCEFERRNIEMSNFIHNYEWPWAQKKDSKQTAAVDLSKRLKDIRSLNDAASLKALEEWRRRKMERARQRQMEKNGTTSSQA
ncbi:hypothetical protein Ahy_B02g059747 [Arachis hypogaea]|uniref:Uncharacterized protein n=1 Tax=Arachis hypogaea TaxID=3818 RepID=A0A445AH67_ARAHY|nr:hypothetical protein Ahy_B02g059747 [Arachis hypogaea]